MILNCSLVCILIVTTSYPVLVRALTHPETYDFKIAYFCVTSYILTVALGLLITAFLCFHLYLISCAWTTIEFCEKRKKDATAYH